jgi:cation diffusion facilitator CzcD-associated flavoprotein CzcO
VERLTDTNPVVVVGAGPHGLATAAHLRAAGVPVQVFGDPLSFWRDCMPVRMMLRSPIPASHISDPERRLRLHDWAAEANREVQVPLPVQDFLQYGLWFQERVAPDVDRRMVSDVRPSNGGFRVRLEDGESAEISRVVVTAGMAGFAHIPPELARLLPRFASHTSTERDLSRFAGRRVAVLGGGQSALESAALLREAGARVEVLLRAPIIHWIGHPQSSGLPPLPRRNPSWRVRRGLHWRPAPTGVGGPLSSWLAAAPAVVRRLPRSLRWRLHYRGVLPMGAHWLPERLRDVPLRTETTIIRAEEDGAALELLLSDGSRRLVDHLLLGTGYRFDVARYPFLGRELLSKLRRLDGYPVLGPGLESSVRGLHFAGVAAAGSFGPVMRFVVGTAYGAPALAHHLARRATPRRFWSF